MHDVCLFIFYGFFCPILATQQRLDEKLEEKSGFPINLSLDPAGG